MTASFESVSTWRQPLPRITSPRRQQLIEGLADVVNALSPGRLRVAVDGRTAAGKTTFAHELAAALRRRGRPTARASLDDFKHPWSHAREQGYDRQSGEGYYRNAYDFASATHLLLRPAGPSGSGRVALCAHDPLTGADHRDVVEQLPNDTVLIVDSVFAFRPQYAPFWDYRIWLEIDPGLSLERGVTRDSAREGRAEASRLHRDRYGVAEEVYLKEVDPRSLADVIVDNTDIDTPRLVEQRHPAPPHHSGG
jgi:uridine kinase